MSRRIYKYLFFCFLCQTIYAKNMVIYKNGLDPRWKHYGWAPHEYEDDGDVEVNFADWGGWIIAYPNAKLNAKYLSFRIKTDIDKEFLNISLGSDQGYEFNELKITKKFVSEIKKDWIYFRIPTELLNPNQFSFDRLKFRANMKLGRTWVRFNDIILHEIGKAKPIKRIVSEQKTLPIVLSCSDEGKEISPYIYGIAYNPRKAYHEKSIFQLNPSIRRWGGNPASRYNWKLGNAWNTAADWYYRNVNYTPNPNYSWKEFLDENKRISSFSAITIPLLGWVAKDTSSYSYPVRIFGRQQRTAPENSDIGNGVSPNGKDIRNRNPKSTSIKVDANYWKEWIESINQHQDDDKNVHTYFLGNEPMLWNSTHKDVHPEATTYDEVFDKTITYSKMIRKAAPETLIAGPTLWGWTAYHYSAADGEAGYWKRPDRKSHGDTPFLEWYLNELKKYENDTGHKSLDILDIHFYPEAKNVYGDQDSKQISKRRLEAVKSLWDKNHIDDSWIKESIHLIPRMKDMIAKHYPGLQLAIGEYNFGGESYMSGGLALAEVLGIFAAFDVHSAYYWPYPKPGGPAFNAFKAYRNYDNNNSRFQDYLVDYKLNDEYSYFISRNEKNTKYVMIFINKTDDIEFKNDLNYKNCRSVNTIKNYEIAGTGQNIKKITLSDQIYKPWSISVIEWNLEQ